MELPHIFTYILVGIAEKISQYEKVYSSRTNISEKIVVNGVC